MITQTARQAHTVEAREAVTLSETVEVPTQATQNVYKNVLAQRQLANKRINVELFTNMTGF